MTSDAETARRVRAYAEKHGHEWHPDVRDWWLVLAAAWDARPELHARDCACPVHIELPTDVNEARAVKARFIAELRSAQAAVQEVA